MTELYHDLHADYQEPIPAVRSNLFYFVPHKKGFPLPSGLVHSFFLLKHFAKFTILNNQQNMRIVFASNNKNKILEIQNMLPDSITILSLESIGCLEDIPETAD